MVCGDCIVGARLAWRAKARQQADEQERVPAFHRENLQIVSNRYCRPQRASSSDRVVSEDSVPDTSEYLARIREYARAGDPLDLQRQAPAELAELLGPASDETLTRRPRPDKWSIGEILAHLAEDEIATAWRYRQMVESSGIELAGFDQDLWARIGDYGSRAPRESLALFRLLRDANLRFLGRLTSEQWECFGIHAERGRITVRDLAVHMAGHDANHIHQIRRILG
jgi:hypothetical protein